MPIENKHIVLESILAGFHIPIKDFNYRSYKGQIFNELREILGPNFEVLPIDEDTDMVRDINRPMMSLRLGGAALIYENLPDENFLTDCKALLKLWQNYSEYAKDIRLGGFLRKFKINDFIISDESKFYLKSYYLKNLNVGIKDKKVDLKYNYETLDDSKIYNINLNFVEIIKPAYTLAGQLDINRIVESDKSYLNIDDVGEIYNYSQNYFETELVKILNPK